MTKKSMRMFLLFGVLIGTLASTAMAWAQAAPRTIDITVKARSP
jgi:hypothetical protein